MGTGRLEAFSDGVIAVIITIMVLELKAPEGHSIAALIPLAPVFLSYVLSFVYVGIYWNNHHHMLHTCEEITGGILWANLHLLFWLSLIPFATAWLERESLFIGAVGAVRGDLADVGDCLGDFAAADHHVAAREARRFEAGDRRRFQGQVVGVAVCGGDWQCVLAAARFR